MNMNIDRMRFCVGGSVFAHGLYWVLRLVVSCSRRFYSFVALIAAVVFMYKTWVNSIWPEIRVPPPEGEDNEQWTPVHPQVFSVPELSRYITDWSESVRKWFANVILLRKTNPGLFCILASSTFAMTAVLGRMVSGVLILYSLLMAVTLGPGIALYVIPATWYEQADALMRIASGKPPRRKQRNDDDGGGVGEGSGPTNTEEEQDELEEFLPKMDERLLAKQLSLSLESDTRSSTHSDTSLLPQGLATAPPLDSLGWCPVLLFLYKKLLVNMSACLLRWRLLKARPRGRHTLKVICNVDKVCARTGLIFKAICDVDKVTQCQ